MFLISKTKELAEFCKRLESKPYVTIDLEFIREKTYFPELCLIQMACPNEAFCIDSLSKDIILEPLFELMQNQNVVKVFHAARQDLEIFYNLTGTLPTPIFDTQVAAMVCGYNDSISYQKLVAAITGKEIDKSMRYSDWARRPLSEKQVSYALADVTHLCKVYENLKKEIEQAKRLNWVKEEMEILCSPETYKSEPHDAWKKIKTNSNSGRYLAILRELAAWRESEAKASNRPRRHILKDEVLQELALIKPKTIEALSEMRGLSKGFAEGRYGKPIIEAIIKGVECHANDCPIVSNKRFQEKGNEQITELLMMLLSIKSDISGVANRLIATRGEIDEIAKNDLADVPALRGWRFEVFGEDALLLKQGKLFLGYDAKGKKVVLEKKLN